MAIVVGAVAWPCWRHRGLARRPTHPDQPRLEFGKTNLDFLENRFAVVIFRCNGDCIGVRHCAKHTVRRFPLFYWGPFVNYSGGSSLGPLSIVVVVVVCALC